VTRASALALGILQDPEAIPALIVYLQRVLFDGDVVSLRAAQRTLLSLSGEAVGKNPREWRAWWRDHRPAPVHARTPG
jgi:HEAT repeat protein